MNEMREGVLDSQRNQDWKRVISTLDTLEETFPRHLPVDEYIPTLNGIGGSASIIGFLGTCKNLATKVEEFKALYWDLKLEESERISSVMNQFYTKINNLWLPPEHSIDIENLAWNLQMNIRVLFQEVWYILSTINERKEVWHNRDDIKKHILNLLGNPQQLT